MYDFHNAEKLNLFYCNLTACAYTEKVRMVQATKSTLYNILFNMQNKSTYVWYKKAIPISRSSYLTV